MSTPASARDESFKPSFSYFLTVVCAWLIPGAGHWLLGYHARGLLLGISVLGLFWVGEALAVPADDPPLIGEPATAHDGQADGRHAWSPMAVTRKVNPIFFLCQLGNGFSTILANTLWGSPHYDDSILRPIDRKLPRHLNLGILFTSVSGLLNYLLVLHMLDPRTWLQALEEAKARRKQASP